MEALKRMAIGGGRQGTSCSSSQFSVCLQVNDTSSRRRNTRLLTRHNRETPVRLPRPDPEGYARIPPRTPILLHPERDDSHAHSPRLMLPRFRASHRSLCRQSPEQKASATHLSRGMYRWDFTHRRRTVR